MTAKCTFYPDFFQKPFESARMNTNEFDIEMYILKYKVRGLLVRFYYSALYLRCHLSLIAFKLDSKTIFHRYQHTFRFVLDIDLIL